MSEYFISILTYATQSILCIYYNDPVNPFYVIRRATKGQQYAHDLWRMRISSEMFRLVFATKLLNRKLFTYFF